MNLSLVILAAGMGSRFGGLKQLTPVSDWNESIIDFSIYDAIRSGYSKVIIIVREEIRNDFNNFFGKRLKNYVDVQYVNQEVINDVFPNRQKPLGTADAVLAAKHLIDGPFSVINADDFYGLESFQKGADFLKSNYSEHKHALIGYRLKNTVSEHGTVSRAECQVDESNFLTAIRELHRVFKEKESFYYSINEKKQQISGDTPVSMNFWCFQPGIIPHFESNFHRFLNVLSEDPDSEFLIPDVANSLIKSKKGSFKLIHTESSWFGITYKEDFNLVSSGISDHIKSGIYPSPLWK